MKILYISSRINAPDGSSVHGRAFFRNVKKLGHDIRSYPEIAEIQYIQDKDKLGTKTLAKKLIKIVPAIKGRFRRLGRTASDLVDLYDGLEDSIRYFLGVRRILKNFSPDCIVFRTTLYNFAPQLIRKVYGLPCVAEVNSIKHLEMSVASSSGALAKLTKWAEQTAIRRSDRVFVVSQPIKDFVDQFYSPEYCSVIANGVETEDFNPELFDREKIRRDLGLQGRIILGYVGSYKQWHGIPDSLDLIKTMVQHDTDYHLLLIGNGEQYSDIKSMIEEQGLQGSVTQIDYIPHEEVPKYTSIFDYAVMTYPDFDGFYFSPLKMYEYMSMGTPVVSTKTGQIGEIIRSGENGQLVYPPTVKNFSQAILKLQSDTVLRQSICESARQEVLRSHSWLGNARNVMSVCQQLLETQGSNSSSIAHNKA